MSTFQPAVDIANVEGFVGTSTIVLELSDAPPPVIRSSHVTEGATKVHSATVAKSLNLDPSQVGKHEVPGSHKTVVVDASYSSKGG